MTLVQAKPYFKKCIELEPSNRDAKLAFSEAEKVLLGLRSRLATDRSA